MRIHVTEGRPARAISRRASAATATPLAWTRALAFGLISGGIGVLGHDLTSGNRTSPLVLAIAIAFATLVARPLAPLRIGPRTMTTGLLLLQSAIHIACLALVRSSQLPGVPGHHLHHSASHHATLMFAMLALHLSLTALGAFLLLELEEHAWRAMRAALRAIFGGSHGRLRLVIAMAFDLTAVSQDARPHRGSRATRPVRGPPRCAAHHT